MVGHWINTINILEFEMIRKEYIEAKIHNEEIIRNCLRTREVNLKDFIFWEGVTVKDLSMDEVMSKWADILGCTAAGAIPSIEKTGADGYLIYSGETEPTPIETKLCGIRQTDLALGKRGGLYYSTNLDNWYSKCSITSQFSGKFDAGMSDTTMASKKRDTFLVLFDKTENKIIDVYGMKANKVLKLLQERKNNATITFKLSAFQQHGFKMQSGVAELEGFSAWEKRIIKLTTRRIMD
jgi:hypothetical protein